ncbi:GNAT family N-acetyltransferase [Ruegeria sp. R13_0]|uniref:GNAT family N-acetyltransferase n=1 Tax=Ruegeria sp. R13_0 TaxID=2821099 RepID=UPI001ADC88BF|nr:GNAT family N-acetyltransferase [Ruegeria sp. R13_0]MBO9436102.1 GNAT family N-acetyltransferase [Ruegeria sp. R13_0]
MTFRFEAAPNAQGVELAVRVAAAIPTLKTERLILRAPQLSDFDTYAQIVASPRARYLTVMSREDAWYDFAQMVAIWSLRGHGLWSVEAQADGQLLGFVVLGFEPEDPEPELGFIFTEEGEGHGYAFEAASAARDFAFDQLGWNTIASFIVKGNARSQRLAERLGASVEREIAEADGTTLVYRHLPAQAGELV